VVVVLDDLFGLPVTSGGVDFLVGRRMLLIDYSSAFNIIVPTKLITKLRILGLNTSFCNWILNFLTGHPQVVRLGNNTSATLVLNTGVCT
jgi:hypothetical protein